MKIKNCLLLGIVSLMAFSALNLQADPMSSSTDCSALSFDEQSFADNLSASNRMMFCSKFNTTQRASAMQMSGQTDNTGKMMTDNDAVEKVAQNNKMMMPPKSRGCPVGQ